MNRIQQKLRSKGGMTILIALVGFLVAAMVSIVIVTAAVTSAQRVANDTKETQAQVTLDSAAKVVKAELEKTQYSYKKASDTGSKTDISATGTFASEMQAAITYIDDDTHTGDFVSSDNGANFEVTLSSGTDNEDAKRPVTVSFVMKNGTSTEFDDGKYDVIFTLKTEDPDEEIYLTANGTCSSKLDNNNTYTYYINWSVVSISRLG